MIPWGLLASFAAQSASVEGAPRDPRWEAAEGWLDAVVFVQQGSTSCAGVHLGAGRVATAYHCVASGGRPRISTRGGARLVASVWSVSPGLDLAILSADLGDLASRGVALVPPEIGERVLAMGHPFGEMSPAGFLTGTLRWSVADGIVSAVGPQALQISAPLNPGNSGGPILDQTGAVVGVASRRLSADNVGFASRADALPALDATPRPMSPLGGTIALHGALLTQTGGSGLPAVGPKAEIALRDRLILGAAGYLPWAPRLAAARFGRSASSVADGLAGLRARLGRGPFAVRLDGLAGVTALQIFEASPEDPLDVSSSFEARPVLVGAISLRSAGFEAGIVPGSGISRASLVVRWPSVLRVF